jgi:acetyl esterase/lipase
MVNGMRFASLPTLLILFATTAFGRAEDQKDVSYTQTTDPYRSERAKLDLYLSKGDRPGPALIWFHGGGLVGGNKQDAAALGESLVKSGITAVIPNYRLSPKATFPAYVEDGAAAVAWVFQHAEELHIDPSRIFVGGHSAGAWLAAMLAGDAHFLEQAGVPIKKVAGFIPVSGQMMTHFTVRKERNIDPNTIVADDAAPIHFLKKDTPPMLIIMGDNDWPARREENAYFVAAAKAIENNGVEMLVIPDRDHGSIVGKMSEPDDPAINILKEFILNGTPP